MAEEKKLTGYPSIDKPWLKYYAKESPVTPSPEMSMYAFLYENTKENLEYTALNYYGNKISYRGLFENVETVASALQAQGVHKGDIVSLCALNTPEFVYLLYALNKIGAVSNWVGLTSPVSDLHKQFTSTDCRIVFTINIAYSQVAEAARDSKVEKIITVPIENSMPAFLKMAVAFKNRRLPNAGLHWKEFIKAANGSVNTAEICPDDVALIEYTGGSTGVPKGVMLSNRAMNSYYVNCTVLTQSGIIPYKKRDKIIFGVPIFLAFGASSCCHAPLCNSMELIVIPDPSPEVGTKMIFKSKANHIIAGRLIIEELVKIAEEANTDLSYLQSIMYGGEETNKVWEQEITQRLKKHNARVPLLNGYGMTESSAAILIAPDNTTDGLIPFANANVKITDPDDTSLEFGYDTEGELCLSAKTLMNGYYQNEEETASVIFEDDGVRWIKTHDLATISPDGIIKITGRIKRIYSRMTQDKIQIRVYPMRIEETLLEHETVHKCAVVGMKDDVLAYRTFAYIVPSNQTMPHDEIKEQLKTHCRNHLPDSHWPDEYVFVESFPITRAGKVDYRALEKQAAEMQKS